jgi:uncharacterized protein
MTTHAHAKPAGTPTWVDLIAPDVEAARRFYRALFGWEYDIGGPEYGGYSTARVGNRAAAGLSGPQPGAPPMPAAWSLYFATDDVEADVARAVELGAKVLFPPLVVDAFGSMAVCEDPTGAAFGFWQAGQHIGSQVNDEPGSAVWYELYSPNARQARDFYTALLGATADPLEGGPEYYVFKRGDDMLCAVMQIDPSWGEFHPQWITYFGVADADAAVTAITSSGGRALSAIEDTPFGRMAAVMDPQGAQFKIIQVPQP